jgi:hypothetical protein
MTESETIIPLSRGKIVALTLGSVAFVAVSIWIWTIPEGEGPLTPLLRKIVSIFGVGFFGICAVYGFIKLFDKKPGLVIDQEGIVDNSSGVAAGRILWSEIIGFQENEIFGQRFLTIQVSDPAPFINRCGLLKAKLNSANLNLTGSPINISANSLSIRFDDLIETLDRALQSYNEAEQDAAG